MREWLVIESGMKNAVFVADEIRNQRAYIPRDVVEGLGIKIEGDGATWFTWKQVKMMRAHPEWRDTPPHQHHPTQEG